MFHSSKDLSKSGGDLVHHSEKSGSRRPTLGLAIAGRGRGLTSEDQAPSVAGRGASKDGYALTYCQI